MANGMRLRSDIYIMRKDVADQIIKGIEIGSEKGVITLSGFLQV